MKLPYLLLIFCLPHLFFAQTNTTSLQFSSERSNFTIPELTLRDSEIVWEAMDTFPIRNPITFRKKGFRGYRKLVLNLNASKFATLDGNLLFFTKGEVNDAIQLNFSDIVNKNLFEGNGMRISPTKFIAIDSIEIDKKALIDFKPRSVLQLKAMEDSMFWALVRSGTFINHDGENIQMFDVPGAFSGLYTQYKPYQPNSWDVRDAAGFTALDNQLEHRIYNENGQKWVKDQHHTYSLLLLSVNHRYPFALIIDEKAHTVGYILSTEKGLEIGMNNHKGAAFGWHFEKNTAPKYREWMHEVNWKPESRFTVSRFSGAVYDRSMCLRDTVTGVEVINTYFENYRFSGNYICAYQENAGVWLYDALLYPIFLTNLGNNHLQKSNNGVQEIIDNELYWCTPKGLLDKNPKHQREGLGGCGTVSRWSGKIITMGNLKWKVQYTRNSQCDEYVVDQLKLFHQSYTDIRFLNGHRTQEYTGISIINSFYDFIPSSTCIGTRQDGHFDLLDLKGKDKQLQTSLLIDNAELIVPTGNYIPLLFLKNGLWGVYPAMTAGRFKKIEPFDYAFARIEMPNGRKGWVNVDGTIFLDK